MNQPVYRAGDKVIVQAGAVRWTMGFRTQRWTHGGFTSKDTEAVVCRTYAAARGKHVKGVYAPATRGNLVGVQTAAGAWFAVPYDDVGRA